MSIYICSYLVSRRVYFNMSVIEASNSTAVCTRLSQHHEVFKLVAIMSKLLAGFNSFLVVRLVTNYLIIVQSYVCSAVRLPFIAKEVRYPALLFLTR